MAEPQGGRGRGASGLRELSRTELMVRLQALEGEMHELRRRDKNVSDGVLHELQVHQVELEMQNRELQETQAALEESRGRYAELYHHAPTGFVTLDRAGKVVEANATVSAMVNERRVRLLGGAFDLHLESQCRPAFRHCVEACFINDVEQRCEVMLHVRMGQPVAVQVCARRALGRWGPGEHVHVSLLNVSDRHQLENQLKFLFGVSDALLDTLDPDVVGARVAHLAVPLLAECVTFSSRAEPGRIALATTSPFGHRHRSALKELCRALQDSDFSRQLLAHRRASTIEVEGPVASAPSVDRALLRQAQKLGLRSIVGLPACSRREVLGTIVLFQHRDTPRRGHLAAFFEDFAQRVGCALDNAQLYRRSRGESLARQNLLAVVSHDLRNPLSVVMLKGEQLLAVSSGAGPLQAAQVRRRADVVLRCAQRMNELIGDLLDATSIESGTFNVSVATEGLSGVIADAIEGAQAALTAKKIVLEAVVEEEMQVSCDRPRTLQVLANILSNACKFTDRGGKVMLRVRGAGHFALISVADTGVGMDEGACSRAFDRFWQSSDTAHLGSGLGLSICRGIVEASGGRIWAQSVLGIGSTFSFTLQRHGPLLPPPGEQTQPPGVLFLGESEGEMARRCTDALVNSGLTITSTNKATEALRSLARGAPPGAVVVELCAIDAGGWDFLAEREGNERLRAIPVVVIGREQAHAAHVVGPGVVFLHRAHAALQLAAQLGHLCGLKRVVATKGTQAPAPAPPASNETS